MSILVASSPSIVRKSQAFRCIQRVHEDARHPEAKVSFFQTDNDTVFKFPMISHICGQHGKKTFGHFRTVLSGTALPNDHKRKSNSSVCKRIHSTTCNDYFETFSSVGHHQTFRLLLSVTACLNLDSRVLTSQQVFLTALSTKPSTCVYRLNFEFGCGKIAKSKKALCGLKQVGRCSMRS